MKRLENEPFTIFDAQIIVYYCFLFKNHRILELTSKTRKLTTFLINNNVKIVVPESIIREIQMKGFGEIISDYTSSKSPIHIIGLTRSPTLGFKYRLKTKIEENFNNMINSNWFEVKQYVPPKISIDNITDFFKNIKNKSKLNEFLNKKDRYDPVPSRTDMELIAFSKEISSPIISNDYDITFFADELFEENLSDEIYPLKELNIYNN